MSNVMQSKDNPQLTNENQSADWNRTRQWVESETGMDLSGSRFERLRDAVCKTLGRTDPERILAGLADHPDRRAGFLERLTGQLTIGESFFFRNAHHFQLLRETVIPRLLAENRDRREVRVWSAGCATGEEPYSLAILFDQLLGATSGWEVSILGTDLNPEFLQRAREARYRQWSFRQTDIHKNRKYFVQEGETYQLVDRLRAMARFAHLNLVKDVYPSPLTGTVGLDLILFRNVAIYLKPEVTAAILQRFYQALRPGGWLLLGETEVAVAPVGDFDVHRFEQVTIYQKSGDRAASRDVDGGTRLPPALAGAALTPEVRLPYQPTLPQWVPLPRPRPPATADHRFPPATIFAATSAVDAGFEHLEQAMAIGHWDKVERELERVSARSQRASLRLRFVKSLLARAEVPRARRMLDLCLTEEPLLAEAQLLKASFAAESGDLVAAEQACRRALYIQPQAPMAHFQFALVLEQKGDRASAARSLKTTMKLIEGQDPHALVQFGDGVCYGRLQEMISLLMAQ